MLLFGMLIGVAFTSIALAASEGSGVPVSSAEAAATGMNGEQVYNNVCVACHYPPGVGGAPALGDAEAWAPRIAQGMGTLIDHALNGFSGSTGVMPKKGERLDLSDEEIIEAIEYMVEQVDR
jgi:cytochrome c